MSEMLLGFANMRVKEPQQCSRKGSPIFFAGQVMIALR
jgi:hypothetical protein